MNESLKGSRHSLYSVLRAPFAQLKSRRFPKWCAVRAPCVIVSLACIFINPPWLSSHGCTGGCDLGRTVTAAGLSAVDAPATLDRAVVLMFPAMSLKQIEYATPPPVSIRRLAFVMFACCHACGVPFMCQGCMYGNDDWRPASSDEWAAAGKVGRYVQPRGRQY